MVRLPMVNVKENPSPLMKKRHPYARDVRMIRPVSYVMRRRLKTQVVGLHVPNRLLRCYAFVVCDVNKRFITSIVWPYIGDGVQRELITLDIVRPANDRNPATAQTASHYQNETDIGGDAWLCHQCREWTWTVDFVCPSSVSLLSS